MKNIIFFSLILASLFSCNFLFAMNDASQNCTEVISLLFMDAKSLEKIILQIKCNVKAVANCGEVGNSGLYNDIILSGPKTKVEKLSNFILNYLDVPDCCLDDSNFIINI